MGAACDTICSRNHSINQIQPDTEKIKSRNAQEVSEFTISQSEGKTTTPPNSINLLDTAFKNDTVLHVAIQNKQYKILQHLLENGASVNSQNPTNGNTALHLCVQLNDIKSVKLLLKYGANAYIENQSKLTPVNIAQQYKYKQILNAFGAEIKIETNNTLLTPTQSKKPISLTTTNSQFLSVFAQDILEDSPDFDAPSNNAILLSYNTNRLQTITDDILADIQETIEQDSMKIVPLKAWLDKKQSSPPYSWLKRWTVVQDGYLLWSDRQISIQNGVNKEEKRRWNNCVNLRRIKSVSVIKTKQNRRFKVSVNGGRDYIWRAKTKQIRDHWVDLLTKHVELGNMSAVYADK
eukprot:384665_1